MRCKFQFALVVLVVGIFAVFSNAASVEPFQFSTIDADDAEAQQAEWDLLIRYKLFGTGVEETEGSGIYKGIYFNGQEIYITDTIGYVGSAKGNLDMSGNVRHTVGGPMLFGGSFVDGDGQDTLMTGPTRFNGDFTVNFNAREKNEFRGYNCIAGTVNEYAKTDIQNTGTLLSAAECATDELVPFVDSNLEIPSLNNPTAVYEPAMTVSGGSSYIDVPPDENNNSSNPYDIYITSIAFGNNGSLYIRMPLNGRLTRIFLEETITGLGSTDGTNIQVLQATAEDSWNGTNWEFTEADSANVITNLGYGGNLLIYTPKTISMGAGQKNLQGTYIMQGDLVIAQNTTFAGQFLARSIQIDADFKANDFRYVPFDPAKIDVKQRNALTESHEESGDTVVLYLDKTSPTNVPFRYCFEFLEEDNSKVKADKNTWATNDDLVETPMDIPVCSKTASGAVVGEFTSASFKKGETTLENPIVLHAVWDALEENREYFKLWVCDLEAAIFLDGDRSSDCYPFTISIADVPKKPLGKDSMVTGYMDVPLSIESLPAMYADSTPIPEGGYSIRIESNVVAGTLTLGGVPVQQGDVIKSSDFGTLVYTGATGAFGAPLDSLTYTLIKNSDNTESDAQYKLVINLVSVIFSVVENSRAKDSVGLMVSEVSNPTYKIIDESGVFIIDASTGKIMVKADSTINYEKNTEYFVDVVVSSGSTPKDTVGVQILIIDVDDPPSIRDTVMSVKENEAKGTKVGILGFFDEDGASSGFRNNTFSLVGGDSSLFAIDALTGEITTRASFDYEALPKDQKFYTITVQIVDDHNYVSTAEVKINVLDVKETSSITVTKAESGTGEYVEKNPTTTIKINETTLTLSWTADGIEQPDTTLTKLHEGYNTVTLNYYDETRDGPVSKDVVIFVSTRTPDVTVSTQVDDVDPFNIFTVVDQISEGDTSFYVNAKSNDIAVTVKEPVLDSTYTDSTCNYKTTTITVAAELDTLKISSSTFKTMNEIADEKLVLNDMPSGETVHTPYNDSLMIVSYTEKVNGSEVVVSYVTDSKGDLIDEQIKVSYETTVDGKTVTISYVADAYTGEPVENKTGVIYTVSYDYTDKKGNTVTLAYEVDAKGQVIRDSEGNVGYEVTYTYTNSFGNTASQSLYIVLDVVPPKVEILSPATDDVLFSNFVDVLWTIDRGDGKGAVEQDTLTSQGLERGANTIVRFFRDKAGNSASDTVYVIMKDAKDVDISIVEPVTLVTRDKAEEYYDVNPPEDGETFAISIYNTKTGKEIETQVGGDLENTEGSGDEPYPNLEGHLGPTLAVEAKVPVVSAVGGLATLDDLLGSDGLVALDGVDAAKGEKTTVEDYVEEHCSAEFQSSFDSDIYRANLYHTTMKVEIWVFTTLGAFVDYFSFVQDLDDPDYVNDAGVLTLYFEQKPDKDGYVRTSSGRLYGTGAYVYKTDVTMKSELLCDLPPVKDAAATSKMGAIRKTSEDLLKPFGYKRPDFK